MSTDVQTEDMKVDPSVLEEWVNKLRAATDVCDKIKEDMEKLKEVYNHPSALCLNRVMGSARVRLQLT